MVNRVNGRILFFEQHLELSVDALQLIFGNQPAGHAGLVGHHDHPVAGFVPPPNGIGRARQELDFIGIRQVARVFDQRLVTIQKDRRLLFDHGLIFSNSAIRSIGNMISWWPIISRPWPACTGRPVTFWEGR